LLFRLWPHGSGRAAGELPAAVPRGCFGPKLKAAIAALTVRNRLSRRQLVELMDELFGCPIAVGTIDSILTRTAETLEPVYEELLERTGAAANARSNDCSPSTKPAGCNAARSTPTSPTCSPQRRAATLSPC
jgi:hypothetical protein